MTKLLMGKELAGFIKERQGHEVQSLRGRGIKPKLVIVRDSDNPVIVKYVELKRQYGEDIGIEVVDQLAEPGRAEEAVMQAAEDRTVSGIIVQLPLTNPEETEAVVAKIPSEKDVDGLANKYEPGVEEKRKFDSATATAINWLLAGHNIELANKKIAVVGRGKLVGRPLARMWQDSGYAVEVFHRGSDFAKLKEFDVVVTATGAPHLITSEMIKPGAVVVDAGTASEAGKLVGDIADEIRERTDLAAITPKIGGVGPLTISVLFENVIIAAERTAK